MKKKTEKIQALCAERKDLIEARKLITPAKWIKNEYVDVLGNYCALGAMFLAQGNDTRKVNLDDCLTKFNPAADRLGKVAQQIMTDQDDPNKQRHFGYDHSRYYVPMFNDNPATRVEDIQSIFDLAIEVVEKEMEEEDAKETEETAEKS